MAYMLFHPIKCVKFNCARIISSHISSFILFFMYGLMRHPFSLFFRWLFKALNVISARPWYFIWLILGCICKINLFRNDFRFLDPFRPLFLNIILIRRRKVKPFLSTSQNIEVSFLLACFAVNFFFLRPLFLQIGLI